MRGDCKSLSNFSIQLSTVHNTVLRTDSIMTPAIVVLISLSLFLHCFFPDVVSTL